MRRGTLLACLLAALAATSQAAPDNSLCTTCTWAVRLLEDSLCDEGITSNILAFVQDNICPAVMPGNDQCPQLAEALLPVAMEWLRNSATPQQLCGMAGVCGGDEQGAIHLMALAQEPRAKLHAAKARRAAARESMQCGMCKYVVNTVKAELDDAPTLASLKAAALQACAALPDDIAPTCTDLVSNYADMLISMIETLDAEASCEAAGLCVPPPASLPALTPGLVRVLSTVRHAAQAGPLAGNMCDVCRLTVLEVHTLIGNPSVQAQISNYTKALCESLGDALAGTCKAYVDVYAPAVYVALQQYLQPDPLCQGMGMCDKPPAGSNTAMGMAELTAATTTTITSSGGNHSQQRKKQVLPGATLSIEAIEAAQRREALLAQASQAQDALAAAYAVAAAVEARRAAATAASTTATTATTADVATTTEDLLQTFDATTEVRDVMAVEEEEGRSQPAVRSSVAAASGLASGRPFLVGSILEAGMQAEAEDVAAVQGETRAADSDSESDSSDSSDSESDSSESDSSDLESESESDSESDSDSSDSDSSESDSDERQGELAAFVASVEKELRAMEAEVAAVEAAVEAEGAVWIEGPAFWGDEEGLIGEDQGEEMDQVYLGEDGFPVGEDEDGDEAVNVGQHVPMGLGDIGNPKLARASSSLSDALRAAAQEQAAKLLGFLLTPFASTEAGEEGLQQQGVDGRTRKQPCMHKRMAAWNTQSQQRANEGFEEGGETMFVQGSEGEQVWDQYEDEAPRTGSSSSLGLPRKALRGGASNDA